MTKMISLEVSLDIKKALPGEMIFLNLKLTNEGDETAEVVPNLDPKHELVRVYTQVGTNEPVAFIPFGSAEIGGLVALSPSESRGDTVPIYYGGHGWTFSEPEQYTIFADYLGIDGLVRSNTITLIVREPETEAEMEQVHLMLGDEQGQFLIMGGGDFLTEGIGKLQALVDNFPDSRMAVYANYALGVNLSRPFRNYEEMRLRPVEHNAALAHLEIPRQHESPALAIQAYRSILDVHIDLGDIGQAESALEAMRALQIDAYHDGFIKMAEDIIEL